MKKQKLLIDGVIFGLQQTGGISRLFVEILTGLEAFPEREILLLLPKNKNFEWASIASQLKRVKVVKRRRPRKNFVLESLYLTWVALRYRPTFWHSSYYVGLPYAFFKKSYITFHDMIGERFACASVQETKNKLFALRAADQILAISHHGKKDLQNFWPEFKKKEIVVIPNALTVGCVKRAKGAPYFLYVGKRRGYKNFLPCLKAVLEEARFKNTSIYVAGGEAEIEAEEKIGGERVQFLGKLPYQKIQQLIANAEALLFPSLYEGFGYPVLEAFALEVPVLACRNSSIVEVAGEGYPLVENGEYAAVLATLLEDRERWIAYGRERREHFSKEKMVAKLQESYAL